MIAFDDLRVEFNGVNLQDQFNIINISVDGQKAHIFAPSKNIITSRPMYRSQDVLTGMSAESLSFNLTLAPYDGDWGEQFVSQVFQLFDVRGFKPLRFGDEEMYYNVIPFVGSTSELMLFAQSQGYVTIPFVCDAPHGWIDREYHFTRYGQTANQTWDIYNPCNVKDFSGECRVYPYIEISDFNFTGVSDLNLAYIWFWNSIPEGKVNGITLTDLPYEAGMKLVIDCYNKQLAVYDSSGKEITNINPIECMKEWNDTTQKYDEKIQFIYLNQGKNIIEHGARRRKNEQDTWKDSPTNDYKIDFYLTCPYMK